MSTYGQGNAKIFPWNLRWRWNHKYLAQRIFPHLQYIYVCVCMYVYTYVYLYMYVYIYRIASSYGPGIYFFPANFNQATKQDRRLLSEETLAVYNLWC